MVTINLNYAQSRTYIALGICLEKFGAWSDITRPSDYTREIEERDKLIQEARAKHQAPNTLFWRLGAYPESERKELREVRNKLVHGNWRVTDAGDVEGVDEGKNFKYSSDEIWTFAGRFASTAIEHRVKFGISGSLSYPRQTVDGEDPQTLDWTVDGKTINVDNTPPISVESLPRPFPNTRWGFKAAPPNTILKSVYELIGLDGLAWCHEVDWSFCCAKSNDPPCAWIYLHEPSKGWMDGLQNASDAIREHYATHHLGDSNA